MSSDNGDDRRSVHGHRARSGSFDLRAQVFLVVAGLGLFAWPLTAACAPPAGKASKPKCSIDQLAWLAGRWGGEMEGGSFEDHWSKPNAGMMMGMFRMIDADGNTMVLEFETIQQTDAGVEFRFRHFNAKLEPWEESKEPLVLRVSEMDDEHVVFVDPTPDQPKKNQPHRMVMRRQGPDQYTSAVYVLRAGKEVKVFGQTIRRAASLGEAFAVKAGCATCIFHMKSVKGCKLAVQIADKAYLVEGSSIDDHGDAHASDGLCKAARDADVTGSVARGRFVARTFKLHPQARR